MSLPCHLLAEAWLLRSSNLIFKPDMIHALFSMPDEVLGCECWECSWQEPCVIASLQEMLK